MLCFQSKNDYKCKIILLDNREVQYEYNGSKRGEKILNDIAQYLNLHEIDYFGFRFIDNDSQVQWLDLEKSIKSQFKNLKQITLYFNVKFYIPDPCKLRYEITRYLFYMQLRADILQGRLPLQFDYAVDLFGYILQDELGDYDSKRDTTGYASEFQFLPNQSEELENVAYMKHIKLKGMSPALVEMNFLNKVKWLDMYGVDLQPVLDENNVEYFIGITPTGIAVYKNKNKVNSYFWPRIYKLDYKKTKFYLTVIDKSNDHKTHVFYLSKESACKHLWKCCVDQHTFFRMKTINNDGFGDSPKLNSSFNSKNRHSIRTLNQFSAVNQNENFKRIPAKRISRRISIRAEEALIIDQKENTFVIPIKLTNDESPFGSQKSLNKADWKDLENQGGLFSNISGKNSPIGSTKSINSYKCPNPRPESASENELNSSKKSRTRRRNRSESDKSDNDNNITSNSRSNSRRRKHRSGSRNSRHKMISSEAQWNNIMIQNEAKIVKSKSAVNNLSNQMINNDPNIKQQTNATPETCHETSGEEDDINELEKKRQIRRRKRSKSPSATKPPGELRQHINYNLVEASGLSADQLREIPFIRVETNAPPFRISPHQKHRKYSPHRRKSQTDLHDSKSSIAYYKNGNAQIIKTNKPSDSEELGVQPLQLIEPNIPTNNFSTATAITTTTAINKPNNDLNHQQYTPNLLKIKSLDNDSGCDELTTAITNSRNWPKVSTLLDRANLKIVNLRFSTVESLV